MINITHNGFDRQPKYFASETNAAGDLGSSSRAFLSNVSLADNAGHGENPYVADVSLGPANQKPVSASVYSTPSPSVYSTPSPSVYSTPSPSPSAYSSPSPSVHTSPYGFRVYQASVETWRASNPRIRRGKVVPLSSKRLRNPETIWKSSSMAQQVLASHYAMNERNPYFLALTLHPSNSFKSKYTGKALFERATANIKQCLRRALGRDVDLLLIYELSPEGLPHLHGLVGCDRSEIKALSRALKKAVGVWDSDPARKQLSLKRGKHDSNPDAGWAKYILKDLENHNLRPISISRDLVRSAKLENATVSAKSFKELKRISEEIPVPVRKMPEAAIPVPARVERNPPEDVEGNPPEDVEGNPPEDVEGNPPEDVSPAVPVRVERNPPGDYFLTVEEVDAAFGDDFLTEFGGQDRLSPSAAPTAPERLSSPAISPVEMRKRELVEREYLYRIKGESLDGGEVISCGRSFSNA